MDKTLIFSASIIRKVKMAFVYKEKTLSVPIKCRAKKP